MMHPNQIGTSSEVVRCLLRTQYPALGNQPIEEQPYHGTDSDSYRVGDMHSVRLPIIDWAILNEAHMRPWLPWLRDRLSMTISQPVYYGTPDCNFPYEWTIYPWIEGETLSHGSNAPSVALDIAKFLMELRNLPTAGVPSAGRSPHGLDADVRTCLAQLTAQDRRDDLIAVWDEMMTTPVWDGTGIVWMHGDIAPGNLLFRDGRLVAAIDWSGLGVGDPANDLQVGWNLLGPTAREVFREAIAIDDLTWGRARARAFAQASFQLPYYRESFPKLASQAQWVFQQILEECGR